MSVFEEDIFSISIPVYHLCLESKASYVSSIITSFFLNEEERILFVSQAGGIEINSNNYCIETSRKKYLLKRWGNGISEIEVSRICILAHELAQSEVPFSEIIKSVDGRLFVAVDNQNWSVFAFNHGSFFSGTGNELSSMATGTGALFNILQTVNSKGSWLKAPEVRSKNDLELFRYVFDNKDIALRGFSEVNRNCLNEQWDVFKTEVSKIFNTEFKCGPYQLTHFDLHPHNVLMSDEKVSSFLDIDSIRLMNTGYALAFASLKLCRQAIVSTKKDPLEVSETWIQFLTETYPAYLEFVPVLADLAISEVLRRIAVILRLNIEQDNRKWESVLKIQLNHLREARILFDSKN